MTLSDTPAFTDIELGIIKHALGDKITASKIAGLHLDILSCPEGTDKSRARLSDKVKKLTPAQRIKLIEDMEDQRV
ncbi:MAG: hypothetical protein I3I94_09210 [Acidaminococcaceae bacterium]|nr:hypothetical protein [Acidaminococcaceae bacterium]